MSTMEHQTKIRMIFKSLNDIVIVGDKNMIITDMNKPAEAFFGWKAEETKGKSVTFLLPSHPLDIQDNVVTALAQLKGSTTIPVVVQTTRDSHATIVAWTLLPVSLPRTYEFGVHMNLNAALTPKLSVTDLNFKGRRVFVRVDFNVPFDKKTKQIRDDNRIRAAVPTIKKIINDGGRLIVASHLGRPKKPTPEASLRRILPRVKELFGVPVHFVEDVAKAGKVVNEMKDGEVVLLENLRFFKGEGSKKASERDALARQLASFSDIYVCDAFGTVHRMTASTTGIPRALGAGVTGFLIEKEIKAIGMVMKHPAQPLVAIVGGSKVSDKINVINSIFNFAKKVVIGGAMAYTFLEAQGYKMGSSKVERKVKESENREVDLHDTAKALIAAAKKKGVELILPVDHNCAKKFEDTEPFSTKDANIPDGYMGLDFGPKSMERAKKAVAGAKTLIWNGPVGVFEFPNFAKGTLSIAEAIKANKGLVSIVGGGETAAATKKYRQYVTHVSTGGGAFLELLEGTALPGLICLTARAQPKL